MNDHDLDRLAARTSETLHGHPEIAAAWIYGSAARGRDAPIRDIDVALVVDRDLPAERRDVLLRELMTALERARPGVPFDVRFLDELPVSIRGRVVTEGRRLLDRDPARRVEAEVRARMEYHDFQFFEREGTREGLRGLRDAVRRG